MSATASISWENQASGTTQELYYGKDALVTGLPGSGTGWIASDQNPLPPTAGSLTITNLDDNAKYRFLVKSDCTNSQNIYSQSTSIKWTCGAIQASDPTSGILSYELQVDPSVSTPGSAVTSLEVQLIGVDRVNYSTIYQVKSYQAPYSSSYADQFNNVTGNIDWTLRVVYKFGSYPLTEVHECSTKTFSTTATPGLFYLHIRNATVQSVIGQLTIASTPQLSQTLQAGYGAKSDITALISGGSPLAITVTMPGVVVGTQFLTRQIRAGSQIAGGIFTYTGNNSNISSTGLSLQNSDILEITEVGLTGYVYSQSLVTKVTGGYNISLNIDVPIGSPTTYTVNFTGYDYATGTSEHLSTPLSIPTGQITSNVIFLSTTLPTDRYARASITAVCVQPNAGVSAPIQYNC